MYAGSNAGTYKKYSLAYRWDVGGDYVNNASGSAYESRGMYDDWAILECDTALGVGHLGKIATNSADSMMDYTYDTQGYPFDKNVAEFGPNPNLDNLVQYRMYTTSGRIYGDMYGPTISARYLDVVAMNLDATQGQSGSPIYRYVSGSGYCAQAMIVAGKDSLQQNYAILINDWLYSVIQGL